MQIKYHIYCKYGSRQKQPSEVESVNIKGGLVNDRSYLLTPGLSLSWYRSQTEKAVFVFFFYFKCGLTKTPNRLTGFRHVEMVVSAHPILTSIFIYLCSRVRQLTSSFSHVSAAHAPTHLCSCGFICPTFCVGFIWVSVYLHALRFGLKRDLLRGAWPFPCSVDTFLIKK